MRVPGVKTAALQARRLYGRLRAGAVVLGYHRVSASSWDPFGIGVDTRHFAEQLEVLSRFARPLPLEELLDARGRRDRRRRTVVVTFDDGYSECLTEVAPLLERHEVPATVFAISGLLGEEPWWERLARILAPQRELQGPIELEGLSVGFSDGRDAADGRDAGAGERPALVRDAHRTLAAAAPERRELLLDRLAESVAEDGGADDDSEDGTDDDKAPDHRTLSAEELRTLARCALVTIGAHGHQHLELAELSTAEQRREIERSRRLLEEILGRSPSAFSYPHGSQDARTRQEVRRAGFACACASRPGPVLPSSDDYALPRLWVPNVDGERFRPWLQSWTGP